jgi:hypothetical protein
VTGWTGAVGGFHLTFGEPAPDRRWVDLFLGVDGGTVRKWTGVWAGGRLDFHVTNRAGIRWGLTAGGTRATFDVGFDLARTPWREDPREKAAREAASLPGGGARGATPADDAPAEPEPPPEPAAEPPPDPAAEPPEPPPTPPSPNLPAEPP